MKLIETSLTDVSVRMRLANDADPAKVTQWVEFEVPISEIPLRIDPGRKIDFERRLLAEVREAALQHARGALSAEIQRLAELQDRAR